MTELDQLATTYLGLTLRSPIVASAGPHTGDPLIVERLEAAGAAAAVLPSLFEEEILHEELELNRALEAGTDHFGEALDYFPATPAFETATDRYLSLIERTKAAVSIPIIASLNGTSTGGWVRYAKLLEEAGADAIELNVYRVTADPDRSASEIEDDDVSLVASVRAELTIPLAVKLSPYYTSTANFARRLVHAGADGLVLFNRFYQPDVDVETLDVVPRVELSQSWELRLPLRWIAILRPFLGPSTSLAATSGVHTGDDVIKALLVGADVAMMTSALLRNGAHHVRVVSDRLVAWLAEHDYESVAQLRGSVSHAATSDPSAFERSNYVKTLHSWSTPVAP
jgi:dihydroorotate dehydrogenase (fumarate)